MGTGLVLVIAAGLIVVAAIVVAVVGSRRRAPSTASVDPTTADAPPAPPPQPRPAAAPMTGLESALDGVTDRSGRPMREHLDAETDHVEQLRVQDDTGPLLRRALDHVAHRDEATDDSAR